MTTHFQPGQHPDADQLNAFAEHALPLHEQQATLAHLATCADCRAIVYLAQPPVPEPHAHPHPAAPRSSFFSRWMLAFPVAAALACLIFLTVHFRNLPNATNQVAAVDPRLLKPSPPPPPPTEPASPPSPAPAQSEKPQAKTAPTHRFVAPEGSASAPEVVPQRSLGFTALPKPEITNATNASSDKKFASGAASGTGYAPAAAPPPAAPITATASPQPPTIHGSEARRELRSAATQYDMSRAQAQQAPASAPSASPNSGIYGGTGPTDLNENYIAAVPAYNLAAAQSTATASDTVTVTGAPPALDTTEAAPLKARLLPTLPSHLPVISIVSRAGHQLAIDTAGALFHSEDSGVTWQPVPAQWTGRALKVALVPSTNGHLLSKSLGGISAAKSSAPSPTFQLTTDSGEVWISPDGQTWQHQ